MTEFQCSYFTLWYDSLCQASQVNSVCILPIRSVFSQVASYISRLAKRLAAGSAVCLFCFLPCWGVCLLCPLWLAGMDLHHFQAWCCQTPISVWLVMSSLLVFVQNLRRCHASLNKSFVVSYEKFSFTGCNLRDFFVWRQYSTGISGFLLHLFLLP